MGDTIHWGGTLFSSEFCLRGTQFTSEFCLGGHNSLVNTVWGTLFTSEFCPGGHYHGGTKFTMTTLTKYKSYKHAAVLYYYGAVLLSKIHSDTFKHTMAVVRFSLCLQLPYSAILFLSTSYVVRKLQGTSLLTSCIVRKPGAGLRGGAHLL